MCEGDNDTAVRAPQDVAQRREAEKVVMTAAERSLNGSIIDTFAKASPERKAKIRERI